MYYEIEGTSTRILGSIHLYPKDASPVPIRVGLAYEWAEKLCIEHEAQALQPHLFLPPRSDLAVFLPQRTWEILSRLRPSTFDESVLRTLKPWAAFMVLARYALDALDGLEPELMRRAGAAGKPVSTLESAEQVAASFDTMTSDSIAEILDHYGDSLVPKANFRRTYEAWVRNDMAGLWDVLKDGPLVTDKQIYELMFSARNRQWANLIAQAAPVEGARQLVIVGVGHLVGPENLLGLLAAKGLRTKLIQG